MLTRELFRSMLFSPLLFGACDGLHPQPDEQDVVSPITGYGTRPNGTGIHVASTQPESWFGLMDTSLSWFMNGFAQHADGSFWATGAYSLDVGLLPADARLVSAQRNGLSLQVQDISTTGSQLSVKVRDASGNVETLQHAGLIG